MKKSWIASLTILAFITSSLHANSDNPNGEISPTAPQMESSEGENILHQEEPPVHEEMPNSNSAPMTTTPPAETTPLPDSTEMLPADEPVTEVGKAPTDTEEKAKRRMWQKICIAVGAVIIATVALILVSANPDR